MEAVGLVCLVLSLWQRTHQVRLDVAQRRLALDRERLHFTQQVRPDEYGVFPLLWDGQLALDSNRGVVFSLPDGVRAVTPGLAQPEQLARLLRAAGRWPAEEGAQQLLAGPAPAVQWPSQAPLLERLADASSCRALVLGVTVNHATPGRCGDGQQEVIRGDISQMVHVAVGGSSGWGKSVFLRVLAYQRGLSRTNSRGR